MSCMFLIQVFLIFELFFDCVRGFAFTFDVVGVVGLFCHVREKMLAM